MVKIAWSALSGAGEPPALNTAPPPARQAAPKTQTTQKTPTTPKTQPPRAPGHHRIPAAVPASRGDAPRRSRSTSGSPSGSASGSPSGSAGRDAPPAGHRAAEQVRLDLSARTLEYYQCIAVFEDDFDPEAAMVVCGDETAWPDSAVDRLHELEAAHLIERAPSLTEQRRYRLTAAGARDARALLRAGGRERRTRANLIDWMWSRARVLSRSYLLPETELRWLVDRRDYLSLAVEWTWEEGTDARPALLVCVLALLHSHAGDRQEAAGLIRRALRRSAASPYRCDLLTWGVFLKAFDQSSELTVALLTEAVQAAGHQGSPPVAQARALTALGTVHEGSDDAATARVCFARAVGLAQAAADEITVAVCSTFYAWHLICHGDPVAAAAAIAAVSPSVFADLQDPHQQAGFEFVIGALELLDGNLAGAEHRFRSALRCLPAQDPGSCFPLEGLGLAAYAAGRWEQALLLLETADRHRSSETIGVVGATAWRSRVEETRRAARARLAPPDAGHAAPSGRRLDPAAFVTLTVTGSSAPDSHPADVLTAREREVAMLVSGGLTNQRIAERLQISRNTVSSHVRTIYDKLGVSSRAQLAAEMTGADAG